MADSAGRSRACEPWAQAPTARRPSGQLRGPPSHAPCGQVTPFNPRKTCLVQGPALGPSEVPDAPRGLAPVPRDPLLPPTTSLLGVRGRCQGRRPA